VRCRDVFHWPDSNEGEDGTPRDKGMLSLPCCLAVHSRFVAVRLRSPSLQWLSLGDTGSELERQAAWAPSIQRLREGRKQWDPHRCLLKHHRSVALVRRF
jgi:hypothetical protein